MPKLPDDKMSMSENVVQNGLRKSNTNFGIPINLRAFGSKHGRRQGEDSKKRVRWEHIERNATLHAAR